jgi:hypothetical protein
VRCRRPRPRHGGAARRDQDPPRAAADYAARLGLRAVGENRVQEGVDKRAQATPAAAALRWELIGHLQSNKARLAARHFDRVQSVDSEKTPHPPRPRRGRGRENPARAPPDQRRPRPRQVRRRTRGRPASARRRARPAPPARRRPHDHRPPRSAPRRKRRRLAARTFANLRTLRDELAARHGTPLRELSMGMTGDLAAAVAAGSTLVRVGTALYGAR